MKKLFCLALTALTLVAAQDICKAQYYKDLFQDSGINLTSRQDLPAARFLGLSYETYYSAKHSPMAITVKDTIEQTAIMVGSTIDENGVLLYPDGAPRFKMIYVNGGRTPTGIDCLEWVKKAVALGAGEILLTSMDADGTKNGYDIPLTRAVAEAVNVPVIASGGAGALEHFYDVLALGKADAVLAASVFHYKTFTIRQVKQYLRNKGVEVRL